MTGNLWQRGCDRLAAELPEQQFNTWIRPLPQADVNEHGQVIDFTAMVNAIITFLITAAVVYFIFVVPMNKFRAKLGKTDAEEEAEEQVLLLREIRDLLADRDSNRS